MKRAEVDGNLVQKTAPDDGVAKGMVRVGTYIPVPAVLRERGIDPAPLLAEFGLEPADFLDPENTIRFREAGRLFARCANAAACASVAAVWNLAVLTARGG